MVGFGSALRIAKRSGWERAYLDYETLKLLLSQIEAVYEEEGHSLTDGSPSAGTGRRKRKPGVSGDYRDDLFLESDSDLAFLSSDSNLYEDDDDSGQSSADEETRNAADNGMMATSSSGAHRTITKPFTLTYSHDSSDEFEDEDAEMGACAGGTFSRALRRGEKHAVVPRTSKPKKKNKRRDDATEFFVGALDLNDKRRDGATEFFVGALDLNDGHDGLNEGHDGGPENEDPRSQQALLNTSFQRGSFATSEQQSLLPQTQSSTMYGFPTDVDTSLTPPRDFSGGASGVNWMTLGTSVEPFPKANHVPPPRPPLTASEIRQNERDAQRRKQRRLQRRRRIAKKRRQLEQRVPRHLRVAHGKARAITERFLGLLRAEVEKVTLFAQSRLGELADTAGSLRFPSYEDSEYGSFSESFPARQSPAGPYEVLSDGGMHPSASSSEEEDMGGRRGPFPWSDSSDEEEVSDGGKNPLSPPIGRGLRKSYSGGGVSAVTEQRNNRSRQRSKDKRNDKGNEVLDERNLQSNKIRDAAKRQIAHFEELRQQRPVFQRNDHIVGEDLLLLSAVDEADGYTAVAVELMHVLRFICVNVIAVRKICRKHDRLLANRMLGGYYHRLQRSKDLAVKKKGAAKRVSDSNQDPVTLGGILSTSTRDDGESEFSSTGKGTQGYKLVGVFDMQIQSLANSSTVQIISSCLALALSEYEVSHSRANALANLNSSSNLSRNTHRRDNRETTEQKSISSRAVAASRWLSSAYKNESQVPRDSSLDDLASSVASNGPPSTASSMSLTRLRFSVVSIFGLRRAALYREDTYAAFLARTSLVFPGPPVAEGLDGCSRETLDFFVSYNPDVALLLDPSTLHEGLHDGRWRDLPIETVMISALATASRASSQSALSVGDYVTVSDGTNTVMNALSITPESDFVNRENRAGRHNVDSASCEDDITMKLNRASLFLYTMNYYIAHPTANAFVVSTGATAAHSASLIGATSLSAVISNALHSKLMSRGAEGSKFHSLSFFRIPLILSSFFPIGGNALYALAIYRSSIPMAFGGRLLVGLGASEIIHRQVILSLQLPDIATQNHSTRLAKSQALGVTAGLLLGSLMGSLDFNVEAMGKSWDVKGYALGSCLLSLLWFVQWIRLCFNFHEARDNRRHSDLDLEAIPLARKTSATSFEDSASNSESNSDSESSIDVAAETPNSILFRSSSECTRDELEATFGTKKYAIETPASQITKAAVGEVRSSVQTPTNENLGRRRKRGLKTFAGRLLSVMTFNVALPLSFALIVLVKFAHEVFFTSCALITHRYFGWHGSFAGLLLGALSVLVLPIDYMCDSFSRMYDERTVIKNSLTAATCGLLLMVNVGSLIYIVSKAESLFNSEPWSNQVPPYDWIFGPYQYVFGFIITFVSLTALEGTTLSLMSKVSPLKLRGSLINCGSIVTYLSLIARFAGDVQILMVGLSHRLINTDIVNSLVIPLIAACFVGSYLVKKHFFFMI